MKVAVAILNWNGKDWLTQFLPFVLKYSKEHAEIFVIDNASTDDSVQFVKENFPDVKIVINQSNGGFSKGYNDGLKQIEADIFVLLNSDVEVSENWILPVLELFKSDESIAAIQPKIKSFHQKDYFEYAGAAGGFIDYLGYPFCRGRIFDSIEKDEGQYDDEIQVFWATGACMFVKAKDYWELGGLDERFFAHMEEIDLCWRLQLNQKKIFYTYKSVVYHVGGGTLSSTNPRKTFLNFRNNLAMIFKNETEKRFFKLFIRLLLDGIAGVKFFIGGDLRHTLAILKAHFSFYGMIGYLIEKRAQLFLKNKPFPNRTKISILYSYFIKKQKRYTEINQ